MLHGFWSMVLVTDKTKHKTKNLHSNTIKSEAIKPKELMDNKEIQSNH